MPDPDGTWEPRIDGLFGLPAGDFVAARESLARELRAEGHKDVAAEVHALRRPTVVAWSVNQVARSHPRDVAALVDAGAALDQVQRDAADGIDTDLRAASRRRRTLLDELTDEAAALTDNPVGHRAAVEATWDGASLDPELQDTLVAGRLTKELSPSARFSFGAASAFDGDAAATPRPQTTTRRAPKPPRDDLAIRRARQALEQAHARVADAASDVGEATEAVDDAQRELESATRRVVDLQAALDDARSEVVDTKRRVTEAKRSETAAKSAERRAAAALRNAEHAASDAEARGS